MRLRTAALARRASTLGAAVPAVFCVERTERAARFQLPRVRSPSEGVSEESVRARECRTIVTEWFQIKTKPVLGKVSVIHNLKVNRFSGESNNSQKRGN